VIVAMAHCRIINLAQITSLLFPYFIKYGEKYGHRLKALTSIRYELHERLLDYVENEGNAENEGR
jgi:hypothetical protein